MSVYAFHAPQMGMDYSIDCDPEELRAVFELFTLKDSTCPNGSSFLVSSEPHDGRMRVYMSKASRERYLEAIRDQETERQLWKEADG